MRLLPIQTVSYEDKVANDYQWAKDTIDFLCSVADDQIGEECLDYKQMLSNYKLYNNELDQEDFERECNPMGIEVGQFKDKIHPYNKTYNKIQVLLGEELRRRHDYRALIINADGIKKKELKKSELVRAYLEAEIQREVDRLLALEGEKTPPPKVDPNDPESAKVMQDYQAQLQANVDKIMNPEEIEKYMSTEYQEGREILVQKLLNYFIKEQEIQDKRNESFKHACITARQFAYVGIDENGSPYVEVLNPLKTFYNKSSEVKYVQHGEYAGYRTRMLGTDIINKFGKFLTEEQKKNFQGEYRGQFGIRADLVGPKMKYYNRDIEYEYAKGGLPSEGSYGFSEGNDWEVTHCEWVSQAKLGFVFEKDEDDEEIVTMVSEGFVVPDGSKKIKNTNPQLVGVETWELPNGARLEWHWLPEVWEGTRIGGYMDDIYVNIRKKSVQFRSMENPWRVALGYHGFVHNAMNARPVSLMDRMKPYQYVYFIVMHKLKKLIAREKGMSFPVDTTLIDEKIGLEKTLYFLEEMDYDIYNSLTNGDLPGAAQRGKVTSGINRSNMNNIMGFVELLRQLDTEIGDAAGVTKQREGGIGAQEAVTNAQQSIAQSSHITEKYFFDHLKLWEQVMASLVMVAQEAWKDKRITKQYALDDMSRHILDFIGDEIYNADFSIFVSNNLYDADLIDTLKQMAIPILQNEGKLTDIIKIYKGLSASQLEQEFKKEEADRARKQQQAEEMQRQMQQQQIEAEKEMLERKFEHEITIEQMRLEAKLKEAEIEVFKFQRELDVNNNGVPDPLEIEKLKAEKEYNDNELAQRKREHEDDVELQKEKLAVERMKAKKAKSSK